MHGGWRSNAPTTACNVAPAAMPTGSDKELKMVAALVASKAFQTLTKNEPIKTPGHTPRPNTRMPAKAMPAEGQTGVAYPGGIASNSANLPARKYAPARIEIWPDRAKNEEADRVFTMILFSFLLHGYELAQTIQSQNR